MKYFKISLSTNINGVVPPGLNGVHVKGKEEFFDNEKCGPDQFYDKNYVFDYLTPLEFGSGREDETSEAIYDYHLWFGEAPFGGWLKPVSERFMKLLELHNLGDHRFYTAFVLFKHQKHKYFVLQILRNFYQTFIDFDKTEFNNLDSDRDLEDRSFQTKRFASIQEVFNYASEHWDSSINWNYERIVMKKEFKSIDFITIYNLGDLVSERLKNAIEKAGLTGMEFEELPIPIEFSDEI